MLAVNGHAKHRQSLCRVGYGKTALSMDLFFITTANVLLTHTFLLLSPFRSFRPSFSSLLLLEKYEVYRKNKEYHRYKVVPLQCLALEQHRYYHAEYKA